jgi:hypothetical protein
MKQAPICWLVTVVLRIRILDPVLFYWIWDLGPGIWGEFFSGSQIQRVPVCFLVRFSGESLFF